MNSIIGVILVVISAVGFGTQPLFARIAYSDGLDPVSLLFLRFSISGIILLLYSIIRHKIRISLTQIGYLVLLGGVGYVGQSLSYFTALTLIPTSKAVIMLYTFPIIVSVLSVLIGVEHIDWINIIALSLSITGIIIINKGDAVRSPLGISLGLLAALIYSVYLLTSYKVMKKIDPLPATAVIMSSAGVIYAIIVLAHGYHGPTTSVGWSSIGGLVIISTILSSLSLFLGMQIIGPSASATISTFEPVTTVIFASIFLNEVFTMKTIMGGVFVIIAGILLSVRSVLGRAKKHPTVRSVGISGPSNT